MIPSLAGPDCGEPSPGGAQAGEKGRERADDGRGFIHVQKEKKSSLCNFRECLWSRNKTWKFCLFNPCRLLFVIAIVQANGVFYNLGKFRDSQSFQDHKVHVRYTNAELLAPIKFMEHADPYGNFWDNNHVMKSSNLFMTIWDGLIADTSSDFIMNEHCIYSRYI